MTSNFIANITNNSHTSEASKATHFNMVYNQMNEFMKHIVCKWWSFAPGVKSGNFFSMLFLFKLNN